MCDDDTLPGGDEPSSEESDALPVDCTLDQGTAAKTYSDGGLVAKGDVLQQDPDVTIVTDHSPLDAGTYSSQLGGVSGELAVCVLHPQQRLASSSSTGIYVYWIY